jgi:LPS sulfotransferase NodH
MRALPSLFILLAATRSGTHFLRSVLTANGAAFAPAEVANAGSARPDAAALSFFAYRRKMQGQDPSLSVPTADATRRLLSGYFETFRQAAAERGAPAALCDIKYTHVVNFAAGLWNPLRPPALMTWAARERVGVIHLVRRDAAAACLSRLYARATGVWRTTDPAALRHSRIRVDRAALAEEVEAERALVALARTWLADCPHVEVATEELFVGDSPAWKALRRMLDHPIPELRSPFLKTTPPPALAIENFDEVADLFAAG